MIRARDDSTSFGKIESAESPHPDELQRHARHLDRLYDSWAVRAAVKESEPDSSLLFHEDKPDFVTHLLPFQDHPDFLAAPNEFKQIALSCGWLAYNEKTAAVESQIVGPACLHLINGDVQGFPQHRFRSTIAQALADEAFHIVLVDKACRVTRQRRALENLKIPQSDLVTSMQRCQDLYSEQWKRILVQLSTAIVSETLISDYLRLLSSASEIQPLNRITTEIHQRDEAAHNGLFRSLGAWIFHGLGSREREFFLKAMSQPSAWFAGPELDVWHAMLTQVGFPNAERMITDCKSEQRHLTLKLDLTTLELLFAELGVDQSIDSIAFETWNGAGGGTCVES